MCRSVPESMSSQCSSYSPTSRQRRAIPMVWHDLSACPSADGWYATVIPKVGPALIKDCLPKVAGKFRIPLADKFGWCFPVFYDVSSVERRCSTIGPVWLWLPVITVLNLIMAAKSSNYSRFLRRDYVEYQRSKFYSGRKINILIEDSTRVGSCRL